MQMLESRRGSYSTISHLESHRSSTPENSQAASSSTFVEYSTPASDVTSFSDVSSVSNASSANDVVWPWWEAEAEHILRGPDLNAIQLLCRYRTYRDSSIPASILRPRWAPSLNNFLLQLSAGAYNRSDVDDLELDQKVREIMKRLVPPVPAADNRRDLVSSTLLLEPNAWRLTTTLDNESSLRCRQITFVDYVREALYPEETVEPIESFIDWHDSLFNAISSRLEDFPEQAVKYTQIEHVSAAVTIAIPLLTRAVAPGRESSALGRLRKPTASTVSSPKSGTSAQPWVYLWPSPRPFQKSPSGPHWNLKKTRHTGGTLSTTVLIGGGDGLDTKLRHEHRPF